MAVARRGTAALKLEEAITSLERPVVVEFDQYPELAFFMAGGADDVLENAHKMQQG